MPSQSKTDLLQITEKEFAKLSAILDNIDTKTARRKRDEDTSLKDVIGHRAHWIALFLGWYDDGRAGREVFFPAKGYKWNQLKAYNAALRETQRNLSWEDAVQMLYSNHDKLLRLINSLSNSELYGGPMQGAKNHWTTGRWAEAAGPSHYRSASKFARQCIREDASPA